MKRNLVLVITVALVIIAGVLLWRRPQPASQRPTKTTVATGTTRMAARLQEIARNSDPDGNVFLNAQRAERLRVRVAKATVPAQQVDLQLEMALELLRSGQTTAAINEFSAARQFIAKLPDEKREDTSWLLDRFLALAYLRLGEQQNCVARHTSESCLAPIGPGGVHGITEGSQKAVDYFMRALSKQPRDLSSVWLLNIAHMTLGQYPDKVAPQFLVPPRVFDSEYDIKRFPDIAPQAEVAAAGRAGGVIMDDFNGDGLLDILCSSWGLTDPLHLFQNNGDGTFTERAGQAGLDGIVGGLNLVQADYDNDGDRDVLVLRGAWMGAHGRIPDSLLRNRGDGSFEDVTEAAGMLSFHPSQTAAWADYDGDGFLDLFIGNESAGTNRHPCELYHNNRDGSFTECAATNGVANIGFVKGVGWGDFDNDGRPDLYLSRLEEPNILYRNVGPLDGNSTNGFAWRFEDVTAKAGVVEPRDSFATWWFDFDNDGWLDLFVASYSWDSSMEKVAADYLGIANPGERPRLFRNNGDGTFANVTEVRHLNKVLVAMGANFGDLDNDGFLDIYIGTGEPTLGTLMPNRMFRNNAGSYFQDVTTSGGFGHLQKGHGIAFGDIDGDGDQDIYAVLGGAYEGDGFQNALFENPGHGNHWLTLRLRGTKANRDGIGARIDVEVTEPTGRRVIRALVSSGGSFGASSLQQEIGLGQATTIDSLSIRWPGSGTSQVFTNLPLDAVLDIEEDSAAPVRRSRELASHKGR